MRTCIGCGGRSPARTMARLQLAADGQHMLVVARPGAGRSAYVHRDVRCVTRMVGGKRWVRSLKAAVARQAREEAARGILAEMDSQGSRRQGTAGADSPAPGRTNHG